MAPLREALTFPSSQAERFEAYIPPRLYSRPTNAHTRPFVTLTFATSLDSALSLSPGVQTALSGPESKSMTHYLRSRHDAILVGCGTAIADNPSLNCRIEGVGRYGGEDLLNQPRPVVLDPRGRWELSAESKMVKLAKEGRGRGPWVFVLSECDSQDLEEKRMLLESVDGKLFTLRSTEDGRMGWSDILSLLLQEGIRSVMVEGGGSVINELLTPQHLPLIDTVIVTIAPTWLGKGSVMVSPEERRDERGGKLPVARLKDVRWVPLGEDVVVCGLPILV